MTKAAKNPSDAWKDRHLRFWKPTSKVAVWKYDTYPYFLCGVIKSYLAKGRVHVEGYDGMQFTPIKILWGAEGKQFIIDHHNLREEHDACRKEFNSEWLTRSEVLLNGG